MVRKIVNNLLPTNSNYDNITRANKIYASNNNSNIIDVISRYVEKLDDKTSSRIITDDDIKNYGINGKYSLSDKNNENSIIKN